MAASAETRTGTEASQLLVAESAAQTGETISSNDTPIVYFTSDISAESLVKIYETLNWTPEGNVAVKFYAGVQGSADAAAKSLAEGTLEYDSDAKCDHHGHHHGKMNLLLDLFLSFAKVGLSTFGGGYKQKGFTYRVYQHSFSNPP